MVSSIEVRKPEPRISPRTPRLANPLQNASELLGRLFDQNLDQSDVGLFVEDNRHNPLLGDQRDEEVLT